LAIGAISTRPLPKRRLDPVRPLPRRLPPVRVESAPVLRDEPCVPVRVDAPGVVALRGCGITALPAGASPQVSQYPSSMVPPHPSRRHLPLSTAFRAGSPVVSGAAFWAGAGCFAGASPQVSQYPSSMVPGQFRWHFMTGHPSRSWP
jgi:hypothetical protein